MPQFVQRIASDAKGTMPGYMEDAIRTTLAAIREESGLSPEALAARIAANRNQDGRKGTFSHTTIYRIESGLSAAPRRGWDELVADYGRALELAPEAIWDRAISLWTSERVRPAAARPPKP